MNWLCSLPLEILEIIINKITFQCKLRQVNVLFRNLCNNQDHFHLDSAKFIKVYDLEKIKIISQIQIGEIFIFNERNFIEYRLLPTRFQHPLQIYMNPSKDPAINDTSLNFLIKNAEFRIALHTLELANQSDITDSTRTELLHLLIDDNNVLDSRCDNHLEWLYSSDDCKNLVLFLVQNLFLEAAKFDPRKFPKNAFLYAVRYAHLEILDHYLKNPLFSIEFIIDPDMIFTQMGDFSGMSDYSLHDQYFQDTHESISMRKFEKCLDMLLERFPAIISDASTIIRDCYFDDQGTNNNYCLYNCLYEKLDCLFKRNLIDYDDVDWDQVKDELEYYEGDHEVDRVRHEVASLFIRHASSVVSCSVWKSWIIPG